jgi:UDP-N-acetylmuramoyl-tripeptide--D-alanyl-D-alanine ligase
MYKDLIKILYLIYQQYPLVTTDSRQCPENSIFFALKGERFDGNQYAKDVLQKGCRLAVVDDATVIPDEERKLGIGEKTDSLVLTFGRYGHYFYVPDVLTTLQQLAACHREALRTWNRPVPVIGITGTNGKTTTKELIKAVLSQKYNVLATEGNLNNQIGVPLTLLKIRPEHELAIVEMGANHPMDIADLCAIAKPDFGLITNVGKAHLLGFGSLEGVIEAKTKLYDSLRQNCGIAFVDFGNKHLLPKTKGLRTVSYGDVEILEAENHQTAEQPSVRGRMLSCSPYLQLSLYVEDDPSVVVQTHLIGNYNLINVIAAAAIGHYFGVPTSAIQAAIAGYEPKNMRSQLVDLGQDNYLILDAYNANPTSMSAAISSFALNTAAHKNLLLGDMRELGEESVSEHTRVLQLLADDYACRFESVLLVGEEFKKAFMSLADETVSKIARQTVRCYADVSALCEDVPMLRNLGGTTLVKGSRGIQLEKAAEAIRQL